MTAETPMIELRDVSKTFTLHTQGGTRIPVVTHVSFTVLPGSCTVLDGSSGAGKSSLLKMIFGSYRCDEGAILIEDRGDRVDIATADPRRILQVRAKTLGYVSQFLRVIPRVGALDIVAATARDGGLSADQAKTRAAELLSRLNIPERLWTLPPATFSGGEQQRVNIARGFAAHRQILLLDEPTASLDAANAAVVVELVAETKARGAAILGVFHDTSVRHQVADRIVDVTSFSTAGAPA
jgi:alpha-D-ribose 1-methylphosphonate 5-triphosphate synthase subunit PhnL